MVKENQMKKQIILGVVSALLLSTGCQPSTKTLDELDWALGTWHGSRRAAEDGLDVPMTVRVERLDCGQIERLQVESSPRPYVGFTIRSRDASGRWTMIYANSTRPSIGRLQGTFENKRSKWESIAPDQKHASRFVSEQIDANHWHRTQFVSEDGGKTWKTLFTDALERAPDK